MRKVIILCDRCGAEIRNVPKRFSVKEVRDAAGDHPVVVPVTDEVDSMDFCEDCFRAVTNFMTGFKAAEQDQAQAVNQAAPVKAAAGSMLKVTQAAKTAAPKEAVQQEGCRGPAELYHDEIELYLSQKKSTKWIAEKLNRYGVGYTAALDAVEKVKAEIEEKLVRKIVKR